MRAAPLVLLVPLLAACSTPGPAPAPAPSAAATPPADDAPLPDPLPSIVARLDGEPIYLSQIVPLARAKLNKAQDQDAEKPVLMRQALREFIDRELLLKEALVRGAQADTRTVQLLYDAARADFPDEEKWKEHLYKKGLDPQTFKAELRAQQTIDVFLANEAGVQVSVDLQDAVARRAEMARLILERLRAKSRIETYL